MSLNQFMHPRNRYRKPPDFKALAIKYPEFRKHAKQDISGKVKFNFKDLEAVRVLTSTLLKEDFDLDVDIPASRLIPTLPLRLNYLLWLEDIIQSNEAISDTVKGVDIGCGASCVYPLLAAKHFGWQMLATEIDTDSAFIASSNVRKNKLQTMITVRSVKEDTILDGVLVAGTVYNFCMCNPPFFSSEEELDPKNVARSASRPLPRNAHSGAPGELVFEGGELAFVNRIIQDSLKLKELIKVYSVMVGHKSTVGKLKQVLGEAGVVRVTTTEFCQGHTTRWGVAWTLDPTVVFPQSAPSASRKKAKPPYSCTFEMDTATTLEKLQQLMKDLQITYSTLKTNQDLFAMEIIAEKNTWSNSRKKRRQEKMKQELDANIREDPTSGVAETEDEDMKLTASESSDRNYDHPEKVSESNVSTAVSNTKEIITYSDDSQTLNSNKDIKFGTEEINTKRKRIDDDEVKSSVSNVKKLKIEDSCSQSTSNSKRNPFLCCSLVVNKDAKGSLVEVSWLRGDGGKEAAHQVLHYFKNNLETHGKSQ